MSLPSDQAHGSLPGPIPPTEPAPQQSAAGRREARVAGSLIVDWLLRTVSAAGLVLLVLFLLIAARAPLFGDWDARNRISEVAGANAFLTVRVNKLVGEAKKNQAAAAIVDGVQKQLPGLVTRIEMLQAGLNELTRQSVSAGAFAQIEGRLKAVEAAEAPTTESRKLQADAIAALRGDLVRLNAYITGPLYRAVADVQRDAQELKAAVAAVSAPPAREFAYGELVPTDAPGTAGTIPDQSPAPGPNP
jgi:hypothetical protein